MGNGGERASKNIEAPSAERSLKLNDPFASVDEEESLGKAPSCWSRLWEKATPPHHGVCGFLALVHRARCWRFAALNTETSHLSNRTLHPIATPSHHAQPYAAVIMYPEVVVLAAVVYGGATSLRGSREGGAHSGGAGSVHAPVVNSPFSFQLPAPLLPGTCKRACEAAMPALVSCIKRAC